MPGRLWARLGLFRHGWLGSAGAGLLSAVGWVLSFPPVSFWPAVVLIVWPMLRLADRTARRGGSIWHAAFWAGIGTIPAWAWLTRWALQGTLAGFPPLVLYLALFSGLAVWAISRCRRAWPRLPLVLVAPVIWVGVEFFRGRVAFDGFPWFLSAHPLIDAPGIGGAPLLAWPAGLVGTYALSGLLVLAVVCIDGLVRAPRSARRVVGVVAIVLGWPLGSLVPWTGAEVGSTPLRVGLVQTNVPQSTKTGWTPDSRLPDWRVMRELIAEAAGAGAGAGGGAGAGAGGGGGGGSRPDVVVMPESMFPGFVLQEDGADQERRHEIVWIFEPDETGVSHRMLAQTVRDDLLLLQTTVGVPMLIGASRFEGMRVINEAREIVYESDRQYNSVFRVESGRVEASTYDKQHLTPFGEVMPYISKWPWLETRLLSIGARGMRFDLAAGTKRTVFPIETAEGVVRCVTPVCFEATIADVCRDLVFEGGRRRSDLIVNVTNDGWFYNAAGGRELHLISARWRCVELATPMVRAANTGISAVIDSRGRVTALLEPGRAGVLVSDIQIGSETTLYARIGDVAGWVSLGGTILGLALTYTGLGKRNRTDPLRHDEEIGAGSPERPYRVD